MEPDTMSKKI